LYISEICWYLNIKAVVTEHRLTDMCLKFHIATASWLVQVARTDDVKSFEELKLPLPAEVPKSLAYLPEFLISNLTIFMSSLDIFKGIDMLKVQWIALLSHF